MHDGVIRIKIDLPEDHQFAATIKEEAKEFKININCILPTIIDTHANRLAMPSADYSGWVKPLDLARLIIFLCSENSKVINGEAIKTSGYA